MNIKSVKSPVKFKIFDKKYRSRVYMYDTEEVEFRNHEAEVSPELAYHMSRTQIGDDLVIEPKKLPYNPDSWKKEKRMIWGGNFSSANGFGMVAENTVKELLKLDVTCYSYGSISKNILGGKFVDPSILKMINHLFPVDCIEIQHCQPPAFKDEVLTRSWLYSMFETTHTPRSWIKMINRAERVIVPSRWLVDSWKEQGVTIPIHVVGHGIDSQVYHYIERPQHQKYTFLHYGQLSVRKGTDLTVKAFLDEFKGRKDVKLILKNTFPYVPVVLSELPQYPEVEFIHATYSKEEMSDLLTEADCFVFPTLGEGFGLPPFESMACFPYETLVSSDTKIEDVLEKDYDGKLITIETDNGEIVTCTTNHPFLTDKGFIKAEDLCIMDNVYTELPTNNEKHTLETRRIGDIVQELSITNQTNSSTTSQSDIQRYNVQNKDIKTIKNKLKYFHSDEVFFDSLRNLLSGRNNRWGRNFNIQRRQGKEKNSAMFADSKYKFDTNDMVKGKVYRSENTGFTNKNRTIRETKDAIYILVKGLADITTPEAIRALSLDEKRAMWNFDLFYRESSESDIQKTLLKIRNRLLSQDKTIEQTRIVKITRKHFKGKVYNLSTADGVYWAENFLVHNTGLPTIVTGWSGPADYVDADDTLILDYKMERAENFDKIYEDFYEADENSGLWAQPSYEDLRSKMRWCYENREKASQMGRRAAKRLAREWSWEKSIRGLYDIIDKVA